MAAKSAFNLKLYHIIKDVIVIKLDGVGPPLTSFTTKSKRNKEERKNITHDMRQMTCDT